MPTISEELIPPFIALTQGGLADYDGVDWSKVEPHIAVSAQGRRRAERVRLRARGPHAGAAEPSRGGALGRDFYVLLTPTSAILPPVAGAVLEAQHAAPDQPVMDVVASVSFTAFGNVTGLPAVSLPLHWSEQGLPVGVMLTAGPWQDGAAARTGRQLEQARPWAERRAPADAGRLSGTPAVSPRPHPPGPVRGRISRPAEAVACPILGRRWSAREHAASVPTAPRSRPSAWACMGMSGMYGPADRAQAIATIEDALDAGVNLLDTGDSMAWATTSC